MLVFGDRERSLDPRMVIAELGETLAALDSRPDGIAGHAALVGLFVEASALAQGLTDAEAAARGLDARGKIGDGAMQVLVSLASAIAGSWRGARRGPLPARLLADLAALPLPDSITTRRAEGYAFYAVYPEGYLAATSTALAIDAATRLVIGIRSIGAGLAAMVAAATDAPLPATVRPRGSPFRRELTVAPELLATWTRDPSATIAIVDEGPGLSGSSFGAVADLLEDHGVPLSRIECYPSHGGDLGPVASPRHRERWTRVRRHVVDADELVIWSGRLEGWLAEFLGPLDGPLQDLSAGAWRRHRYGCEADWPASVIHQERRKLLAHADGQAWLARFVGLGRDGDRALARARTLHAAGFTPEVRGLCHGFLVERWLGNARSLDLASHDRQHLVDHVGRYLGFRARAFPAPPDAGATATALVAMARHNTRLTLGDDSLPRLDRRIAHLDRVPTSPIEVDARLHAWEWLVRADGTLVKADALDHHASHDLVGCQDVAWDLAGAAVELALVPEEERRLADVVAETAGRATDPELRAALRPCYLAFQLGRHALAIDACGPTERPRLRAIALRYTQQLRDALTRAS